MFQISPEATVAYLNALPPEAVWALLLVVCFGAVLTMFRLFGQAGLYAYIALAIIAANVQVVKPVQFSVFPDPVALGTILFVSTFLCTDLLTEFYGRRAAQKGVFIGFSCLIIWVVFMVLTLGFRPMTPAEAGDGMAWALDVHNHMSTLFTPMPALLVAGLAAYLISQTHDIWLYGILHKLFRGRHLWLRNNASTMVSSLIDNIVFSVLAWVVFAPQPVGFEALIFTYILGTYVLKVAVAALDTPFIYLARYMVKDKPHAYA